MFYEVLVGKIFGCLSGRRGEIGTIGIERIGNGFGILTANKIELMAFLIKSVDYLRNDNQKEKLI